MNARRKQPIPSGQRGSALLAALCFATVLALALTSYISLCYYSLNMSSRSLQSSHSIELAEAGLERSLWAINTNHWSGWNRVGNVATKSVTGFAYENGVNGQVNLTVTNYNTTTPTITAAGVVSLPDGTSITRTLQTTTKPAALFVNAIAATTSKVKFKSGGTVDSYDSSLGNYSSANSGFTGIVLSGSTSASSATVQLGTAQIKGYVLSNAAGASPSYTGSAMLIGPTTASGTYVDAGRLNASSNPYQPVFDENTPGAGDPLPSGTATIGTGDTTPHVYQSNSDVDLTGSTVLTVNGPVVLNVNGHLNIQNTAKIVVTANGSLEIHVSGDLAIDGNGIVNQTKLPKKLSIISTSDAFDSYEMGTNTDFYGMIYTPINALTVSNSQTIYGAVIAKSVTFNATPAVHYDMDLRNAVLAGISTPASITSWTEN